MLVGLVEIVEIVYGYLYAKVDREDLIQNFELVRGFLALHGTPVRAPSTFPVAGDGPDGWGPKLSVAERDAWRSR